MKIKLTIDLVFAIIENSFFFAAFVFGFLADWKIGLVLILYEIARGFEYAREFEKHRGQIQLYIKQVLTEMFTMAKEELREERKNSK
jgi:hypothetical protein